MSSHSPNRPTRPHPAGASSASYGRRSALNLDVGMLRAARSTIGRSAFLFAWIVAVAPLLADGEPGKGEKARTAKTKGANAATAKQAVEKKPAPFLPFLQLPEQKVARAEVEASSLAPALKEKLLKGDPLSLRQVEDLGRAGLNPELIIKCLRTSGSSHDLLTKDIDRLRTSGLADSVIDYLLTTRSRRPAIFYPSLYYSPWLHYDIHHDDHHFGGLHHSDSHFGGGGTHHH